MAIVTVDADEAVRRLRGAGFDERQIETVMRVLADPRDRLATREHLEIALAPLRTDMALLKWGVGLVIAGVAAQLMKAFFS